MSTTTPTIMPNYTENGDNIVNPKSYKKLKISGLNDYWKNSLFVASSVEKSVFQI